MAFLDHNGESEFPMSKDTVFNAMCHVIPIIKGMKIENADKLQGRILVKGGISLFSWGENIPIQLIEVSENKTKVQITSSPKTGAMLGGAFDMGKNRDNIERILSATSRVLSLSPNITSEYDNGQPNIVQINHYTNFALPQTLFTKPWYDNKLIVLGLCLIFFPVGFYALWKNSTISKGWKIGIVAIFAVIMMGNFSSPKNNEQIKTVSAINTSIPEPISVPLDRTKAEKDLVLEKLKAKAKRDWPNDYSVQEFWVRQEMHDYEYMMSIEDNPIKRKAIQDWPLDFTVQKFWYNEQIDAKERMEK